MSISNKIKSPTAPLLNQADSAADQHQHYVDQFVTRGRQELYGVLASIYGVCLAVEHSGHKDDVIEQMRKLLLETHNIKVRKKTAPIAVVIRYITRAMTKTVSVYKRVLTSAMDAGISEADLPAYITENGGIDKCGKAIVSAEAAKAQRDAADMARKGFRLHIKEQETLGVINFKNKFQVPTSAVAGKHFYYAICKPNYTTNEMEVVGFAYPNLVTEETLLSTQYACIGAVAYQNVNAKKFESVCDKYGIKVDVLQAWKNCNGMTEQKTAHEYLKQIAHYGKNYDQIIAERKAAADTKRVLKKAA